MNDIKNSLIKIANHNPNLKKDLISILEQANNKQEALKGLIKLAYVNPEIREYALPLIKQGGIKDLKRKQQQAQKKQEKKKSEIPKNVADAAKNKNFSSIPLKEYMKQELGDKKFRNPALKENPNAQEEVAISTILNHAADPNDSLQQDSIKLVEPLLKAIEQEVAKEEGGGEEEAEEVKEEAVQPTESKPIEVAQEGSPQSIVQNSEAKLDQQIETELPKILEQPSNKQEELADDLANKHLEEKVTNVFQNLGVPNATEVGKAVVEAKKEDKAREDESKKIQEEKEKFKRQEKYFGQFADIAIELQKNEKIFNEAFESKVKGLAVFEYPKKTPEELKDLLDDYKKDPNVEKTKELLSLIPNHYQSATKRDIERKKEEEQKKLAIAEKEIALSPDIQDIKLDDVKAKDVDAFIEDKDSSTNLKSSSENLINEPTKENLENTLNNLPETVAEKVVEDLKENGITEESIKAVAVTANNVSQMLDDYNSEEYWQTPGVAPDRKEPEETMSKEYMDEMFDKKSLTEKMKSLKDGFVGAFQKAKDLVKYKSLVAGGGESQMDAGMFLQERGLNFNDLYGEKREEALKAMDDYKNIHETKNALKKELDGVPQDKLEELGKLKDKLSAKEYSKIIKKIKGEDDLKDIVNDEDKYKAFKEKIEKNRETLNNAKDMGLEGEEFDEESSEKLKDIHGLLKDKNLSNSVKKELAKDFIKGTLNKDDIDLFDKVRLRNVSDEDKQNLGEGNDLQKFRNLKKHNDKKELIKEFAKNKKYKDETIYNSPEVSYDEIVALSKSEDEDDKKWAKNKLKEIEKDYDKDVESKLIMRDKEREEIEKLFKTESGEDIKLRDDREGMSKKYTLNQIYEMAENSQNPKDQAWATKKIEEIRKGISGETEATEEEIKEERKEKLHKEKKELETKLKTEKERINKEHGETIKKIDDHHNSQKEKIEKGVSEDIGRLKKDHETKIQQKRDEADVQINDILKSKGFDVNSEKEKIDKEYESNIASLLGQDDPVKLKEFEDKKNKAHQDLETKRQGLMKGDPSIDQINKDFNNKKRTEEGHLTKKIKKKEKDKEDSLNRLETETMASKAIADQKTEENLISQDSSHLMRTLEIDQELQGKKIDKALDGASNLSTKQKKDLKRDMSDFEKELEDLDEEEAEDRSRELVKKVRSTGKGNKELERLIMENNKALLDMYYGRGGESKKPTKKQPKKKEAPKTEKKELDSILEREFGGDGGEDESMTSFFSGKTFSYIHNVNDGTDQGIDRKKNVDFKELLANYRKTKSVNNPYNKKTTANIKKVYEEAKKTYEQKTGINKKAKEEISRAEELKQRIKEKSKFTEEDFEELKPYFGDDLKFDKEKYLEDKKNSSAQKLKEIEQQKTKLELDKTKSEVMELKRQMAILSESKKASLKKQLIKIALSSKKEIKDIILPLI